MWVHRVRSSGAKSNNIALKKEKEQMSEEKMMRRMAAVKVDNPNTAQVPVPQALGERKGPQDGKWDLIYDGPRSVNRSAQATIPIPGDSSSVEPTTEKASEKQNHDPTFSRPTRHETFKSTVEDAIDESEISISFGKVSKESIRQVTPSIALPQSPESGVPSTSEAKKRQSERNERAAKIAKDE